MAATGVELVLRRQFAERGLRRAFVLVQGLPFVAFFLPRLPVDDGAQRHALLREGVVWNQPFVGEKGEHVAVVDVAADGVQRPPFGIQFLDFANGGFVLRPFFQSSDAAA